MNPPDDEQADSFTLAEEERAAIMRLWVGIRAGEVVSRELLAHVTDLCDAYRAQGYVMGDLAHDGTLEAQAEAPAQAVAVDGWICETCGCWNRDGGPCKYDGDNAHLEDA